MKKAATLVIIIIALLFVSLYGYVTIGGESILRKHCEKEMIVYERVITKIKADYSGQELRNKLKEWSGIEGMTVPGCIGKLKSDARYNEMNIINKAKYIFMIKLLDK